jgi:hypothetical protein
MSKWSVEDFEKEEIQKAYDSYPKGEPVKYCWACGKPLVYNSMAYIEGFHFDTCD